MSLRKALGGRRRTYANSGGTMAPNGVTQGITESGPSRNPAGRRPSMGPGPLAHAEPPGRLGTGGPVRGPIDKGVREIDHSALQRVMGQQIGRKESGNRSRKLTQVQGALEAITGRKVPQGGKLGRRGRY